jgi:thiol-disulfide isomerase/thioredoxin
MSLRAALLAILALLMAPPAILRAQPAQAAAAPSWRLMDVDGNAVTSGQFKGKVLVLDFWATWCGPCKSEIPGYVALQKKYGPDGLVIVGVSVDEEGPGRAALVKKFMRSLGMNYTVVFANDDIVGAVGGIDAIPTTFLIDREGNIRDKKVGAAPTAEYERKILAVLKPAT